MRPRHFGVRFLAAIASFGLLGAACGSASGTDEGSNANGECTPPETPVLTFAGYSTPREAYGKIIPAFQSMWKEDHNDQQVIFQESYAGSTTQAQNIVNGFEADIYASSLGLDVDYIVESAPDLITHDWTATTNGGMVSTSVVVLDVRPGNPLGIQDFDDLAQPGVEVLTPDPASSGGAKWNIVAAYGASMRGDAGGSENDPAAAEELLTGIFSNVIALDRSARDSIKNFETGNGDVAITYENEVFTAQAAGLEDEAVYPPSTVLIENPVVIVDANVDKHCVRDVAEAFVEFLHTEEAQEIYRTDGFLRPVDPKLAARGDEEMGFPPIEDLWTVADFGGWAALNEDLFGEQGVFTSAFEAATS